MDPERTNPASGSQFVQHGYSPSAPKGLVGNTGRASAASLVLGVAALMLAAWSTMTFVAWLTAVLGVAFGMVILLPRATPVAKVNTAIGVVCAIVAVVLLLS